MNNINQTRKTGSNNDGALVSLLAANQRKLYAYIMSLTGNVNDSDDILQETVCALIEQFERYQSGTDFLAWATTIAYYKILDYRKRSRKEELVFDDDIFDGLQHKAAAELEDSDDYLAHLKNCIQKLSPEDRNLIDLRYSDELEVKEMAARFGRQVQSIYRSIARIQNMLRGCVKRQVAL